MSEGSFVCPSPLVYLDPLVKQVNEVNDAAADIYQQYTVISIYPNSTLGMPCVVPCPTVIYSEEEWDILQSVLFLGSLAALIASLVSLISHLQGELHKYVIQH